MLLIVYLIMNFKKQHDNGNDNMWFVFVILLILKVAWIMVAKLKLKAMSWC